MDCLACTNNEQFDDLPPRERIAADEHWRVAHAFNTTLPGWLVLLPRRHVTSIADLSNAEAAPLGTWQVLLSRALHAVTGCAKTYIMQFGEHEGFGHVHFHVVPRMPDMSDDHRGPAVFRYLVQAPGQGIDEKQRDSLAVTLQTHLGQTHA
jgi:diadenosine tetraphosphate (Ap4A) HIT family hydrolase